jgi:hypothetical protein
MDLPGMKKNGRPDEKQKMKEWVRLQKPCRFRGRILCAGDF